jgi:hypothetical protein
MKAPPSNGFGAFLCLEFGVRIFCFVLGFAPFCALFGPNFAPVDFGQTAPMKSNLDLLRESFPNRIALSPKEVAKALCGKDTPKRVERVRAELDAGTLIPGLRKDGPRWRVPLVALAEAMDATARPPVDARAPSAPSTRRRSPIGPRLLLQKQRRARDAWGAILAAMLEELNRSQLEALTAAIRPGKPGGRSRP